MNQPLVIDNGTGMTKAGFAGTDKPRVVFHSYVGRPKHQRVMNGGALEGCDVLIGTKADQHRGALVLSYPMEHGMVQNWQDIERIWRHVYAKENMNVPSEDHAVLITEPPLNPTSNREKTAEIFFEALNVPALQCSIQAILSLYASGRTTGVVVDAGDGVTHAVPVYEGFALPHAIVRMDIAGRDITQQLQHLFRRGGYNFNTSSEFEVVRHIKESCCVVAFSATEQQSSAQRQQSSTNLTYQLPDGTFVELGSESYMAPEILFRPELLGSEQKGIHDCLVKSIMRTDVDLRRTFFSQIILSGGSSLFPGFGDRFLSEVKKHPMSPKDTKIRISAPTERLYSTFVGGSILASLSTFKNMWVSKSDWQEQGTRAFTSKTF